MLQINGKDTANAPEFSRGGAGRGGKLKGLVFGEVKPAVDKGVEEGDFITIPYIINELEKSGTIKAKEGDRKHFTAKSGNEAFEFAHNTLWHYTRIMLGELGFEQTEHKSVYQRKEK